VIRRTLVGALLIGLALLLFPAAAGAAGPPSTTQSQVLTPQMSPAWQTVQQSPLNSFLGKVNQATQGQLPSLSLESIVQGVLHGSGQLSAGGIISSLWRVLTGDLSSEARLLGQLLALGVIAALLELLADSFDRQDVSRFGTAAVYVALAVLALSTFFGAVASVRSAISLLVGLMQSLLPLVTLLLAGGGAFTTAGIYHPLMLVAINLVAILVQGVVVPALIAAVVLDVIGNVTGFKLSGIATLLRQIGLWSTGAGLTLFLGLVAIYGNAGPVMDGVALRSGKFLANTFIPVVGKLFSDATEMVFGSTYLLKDAVGIAGLLGVAFVVIVPLLKILILILVFRIAAAVLAPIGAKLVTDALSQFATSLAHLAVALGAVGIMFFLSMTIVFSAGKGVWG
jgi:stage III sporulation protein AE